ncbi:MAG: response regulator [Methylophaga sp.]|nr:response regulator [Methylophaga sp.]
MLKKIRIVLADDHPVVRAGLSRVLAEQDNITIVGEANSGEHAYQTSSSLKFDVLVMNITISSIGGLEALRRILARDSEAKVLMFSMDENITFATQALTLGAVGYIAMSEEHENLVNAVTSVAKGENFLSTAMAQRIAIQSTSGNENIVQRLTSREFEIFRLIVEGKAVEGIAKRLSISRKTVANYQTMLKHKLGVSQPVELVRLAMKYGVIDH